jgi:hypothetical protein
MNIVPTSKLNKGKIDSFFIEHWEVQIWLFQAERFNVMN